MHNVARQANPPFCWLWAPTCHHGVSTNYFDTARGSRTTGSPPFAATLYVSNVGPRGLLTVRVQGQHACSPAGEATWILCEVTFCGYRAPCAGSARGQTGRRHAELRALSLSLVHAAKGGPAAAGSWGLGCAQDKASAVVRVPVTRMFASDHLEIGAQARGAQSLTVPVRVQVTRLLARDPRRR